MLAKTSFPSKEVLDEIGLRDKNCVYCHKNFDKLHHSDRKKDWETLEHLNHRSDWDSVGDYVRSDKKVSEIVALCCWSCNSSRGNKKLVDWFRTPYCLEKNINNDTVSDIVKEYIRNIENNV